ncbi:DUF2017 domain-containing protein [Corynebacterium sanguinis]|uniref:DUF2017 domain-containing protein n=1 Tax=Corynebacterium sanguinis TaxID=2594913 RepID=A0A6C1TVD0_9CORY|nr:MULTISPECIES: DUF2017 domain-containing protein [Corynebacterium]MBA4505375.1 DUF2017 domain-containing protein [Corynebacterium sanguinis]MCT1411411.1 DUF2017 domain-containing protein [Corynebacterium sanguinis]MCT1414078.1 DUF2017 domain-containing protein [Corynebacterium sanguinis]MCT1444177.1 DUF2017 domain-containing protein [Corynebacterium sanguinis]MCT1464392.1 DUF2017 domain-containing protein [Corynebacterium sanguinis]
MEHWKRKKGLMRSGVKFTTRFDPLEREVIGDLTATVSEALIARAQSAPKDEFSEMMGLSAGHSEAPADPRMRRLLPDFEMEGDEEFDGDNGLLRSLHENDIIKAKLMNLQVINSALGPTGGVEVTIDEAEAHAFLAALNDMRLYVSEDDRGGEANAQDREMLLEWLAFCQDSLLQAMMD